MTRVDNIWYGKSRFGILAILLLPFSLLMWVILSIRRYAYHFGIFKTQRVSVPVIVVGNITVGGSGKTPLVCWLVNTLKKNGLNPGVVSAGYGGRRDEDICSVSPDSDPKTVGDEAVLIVQQTNAPMVVGKNRVKAATELLNRCNVDIIVSDDGMQHYALHRDIEIAVIDAERRFGNAFLLPAGPLREPVKRLKSVDFIVSNGCAQQHEDRMSLIYKDVRNLSDANLSIPLSRFENTTVHAVAGIGNPQRFFNLLKANKIQVIEHAFADHYAFDKNAISFHDSLAVIMTQKDAVKCNFGVTSNYWYLPVYAQMSAKFEIRFMEKIKNLQIS